jgi:hypothetical protein
MGCRFAVRPKTAGDDDDVHAALDMCTCMVACNTCARYDVTVHFSCARNLCTYRLCIHDAANHAATDPDSQRICNCTGYIVVVVGWCPHLLPVVVRVWLHSLCAHRWDTHNTTTMLHRRNRTLCIFVISIHNGGRVIYTASCMHLYAQMGVVTHHSHLHVA